MPAIDYMQPQQMFLIKLEDEKDRVREHGFVRPDLAKNPAPTLNEFRQEVRASLSKPTARQIEDFIVELRENHNNLVERLSNAHSDAVFRLVPLVTRHVQGVASPDESEIARAGGLDIYIMNETTLAVEFNENLFYLEAVLPQELVRNSVVIPKETLKFPGSINELGVREGEISKFYQDVRNSVDNLVSIIFDDEQEAS